MSQTTASSLYPAYSSQIKFTIGAPKYYFGDQSLNILMLTPLAYTIKATKSFPTNLPLLKIQFPLGKKYFCTCYCIASLAHGGWSAWGGWGRCSGTCEIEGILIPQQQRTRTCTNPPPSISPRGNYCPGSSTDTQQCIGLPFCAGETCFRKFFYMFIISAYERFITSTEK